MKILTTLKHSDITCENAQVIKTDVSQLESYSNDNDVVCIATDRSGAKKVSELKFPNLKFIQLESAGFEGVPVNDFAAKGVTVSNAGDIYATPISEFVIYSLLKIKKRYNKSVKNQKIRLRRNYHYIDDLSGSDVLICSAGKIGTAIAKRISAFDCNVTGYDIVKNDSEYYDDFILEKEVLKDKLSEFDIIVNILPDNESTKLFWSDEMISCIKQTAIFVNVGRKSTIDLNALYNALKSHKLGFAVLDMFSFLPNPITNKFMRLSNCIVLPGVTAISKKSRERLGRLASNNIEKLLNGEKPMYIIGG